MERRERTHRLIELGGLIQKSGLADAVGDDRATLYGALLSLRRCLRPTGRRRWRSGAVAGSAPSRPSRTRRRP
ncbi:MAG: conjugal transfer protein TraD [Phenylobacterium sp.]|uniref:conjugal transfer protein TraD n=1 Tax=Phenylobacterium sp. TaxID=1871053 RepID=UPI00391A912A